MLCSKEFHNYMINAGYNSFEDENGETLLHKTCRGGNKDIVPILLKKGFDVNQVNSIKQSPLHIAVWNKHKDIVKILLANDSKINFQDMNKQTPLHLAIERDLEDISDILLCFGAGTDCPDKNDETALHKAYILNNSNIAEMLLDGRADFNMINKNNQTALDIALLNKSGKMLMIMISFVLLQKELNNKISSRILETLNSTQKLKNMQIVCEKDLKAMQKFMIVKNISCYKLLTEPHEKLAKLLDNNEIQFTVQKLILHHSFPSYTTLITCHFKRAFRIYQYKKLLTNILKNILRLLPEECIHLIIDFFSESDLTVLAYQFNFDSEVKNSMIIDIFTKEYVVI